MKAWLLTADGWFQLDATFTTSQKSRPCNCRRWQPLSNITISPNHLFVHHQHLLILHPLPFTPSPCLCRCSLCVVLSPCLFRDVAYVSLVWSLFRWCLLVQTKFMSVQMSHLFRLHFKLFWLRSSLLKPHSLLFKQHQRPLVHQDHDSWWHYESLALVVCWTYNTIRLWNKFWNTIYELLLLYLNILLTSALSYIVRAPNEKVWMANYMNIWHELSHHS